MLMKSSWFGFCQRGVTGMLVVIVRQGCQIWNFQDDETIQISFWVWSIALTPRYQDMPDLTLCVAARYKQFTCVDRVDRADHAECTSQAVRVVGRSCIPHRVIHISHLSCISCISSVWLSREGPCIRGDIETCYPHTVRVVNVPQADRSCRAHRP